MTTSLPSLNTLYSYIYTDDRKGLDILTDDGLIRMLNDLRAVNIDIDFPKIVVVGTQSSGKSTLLNAIMNKNILPTGKNMVTRTPLDIRMIKSEKEEKIEINNICFKYNDYRGIGDEIENITNKLLGHNKSVGNKPIIINVYNKKINNLSLIDLPGLTMVACTDKGQPENIKEKIRDLISYYIKQENTIILAVMTARSDLEADIGLDMIKECDKKGERTLGVITKVDLMNTGCDMTEYLENNISKDLQLNYGYHIIMNKKDVNEIDYFIKHPIYSNEKYKHQLGINELTNKIKKILVDKINKEMPNIKKKLINLNFENNKKLELYGTSPPVNINERKMYIQTQINKINNIVMGALNERGFYINAGSQLKNEFIKFRKEIMDHELNRNYILLKEGINRAIMNYDGNHMSYSISPIEILEYCIQNDKLIEEYLPFGVKCVENIQEVLYILINEVLLTTNIINRFPKFYEFIKTKYYKKIKELGEITIKKIDEIVNTEVGYIWSDDKDFIDELKNKEEMEKIISFYMITFIKTFQNLVPKFIMHNMISKIKIPSIEYDDTLLEEKEDIEINRKESLIIRDTLNSLLNKI